MNTIHTADKMLVIPGLVPGTYSTAAPRSNVLHHSRSGPMGSRHKAGNDARGVW
jgi:hypothetical protein